MDLLSKGLDALKNNQEGFEGCKGEKGEDTFGKVEINSLKAR